MHPFIRPGDWVTVIPSAGRAGGEIRPGDCVVFRDRGKRWLIHRVIDCPEGSNRLLTKGDALLSPDHPVERKSIAGVVAAVERRESGRSHLLDRPRNRFLGRLTARLSRFETVVFSAFPGGGILFIRLVKSPRWILTRLFFP